MEHWHVLLDVLVLLAVALALGTICELFRQSAILGYLLAGTLLGPNALHWISNEREVETLAELGVALLLFTIGLEFSWRRLKRIGPVAFGGGSLQVVVTLALAALIAMLFGAGLVPSIVIGSVVALSSTAVVLRVLMSRAEIDSVHGTSALGILLMQDIAVVPLILIVTALQGGGSMGDVAGGLLKAAGMAAAMGAGLFVVAYYLVGPVFGARVMARNREHL